MEDLVITSRKKLDALENKLSENAQEIRHNTDEIQSLSVDVFNLKITLAWLINKLCIVLGERTGDQIACLKSSLGFIVPMFMSEEKMLRVLTEVMELDANDLVDNEE